MLLVTAKQQVKCHEIHVLKVWWFWLCPEELVRAWERAGGRWQVCDSSVDTWPVSGSEKGCATSAVCSKTGILLSNPKWDPENL